MKILSFGEIIWDVYKDKKCIGGAPLNFAAHASLLGAKSSLISAVGNDELGNSAIEYIRGFRISPQFIKKNSYTTGICDVTVNDGGIPSYSVRKSTAYDNIEIDKFDTEKINRENFDLFYFGTLIQREDVSRRSLLRVLDECRFKDVVCDVNLRDGCYDKESALTCLKNATILKISDEEEPYLRALGLYECKNDTPEDIADGITERFKNIKILLITMGEKGAFLYESKAKKSTHFPAKRTKVVSTVGAGDSFIAAFCVAYLSGKTLAESVNEGINLSSFVVSRTEAVPNIED